MHDIKKDITNTFKTQLEMLSNESQEAIARNYATLDNIVTNLLSSKSTDMAKNFIQYTNEIEQYTNNIMFLADKEHNIAEFHKAEQVVSYLNAQNRINIREALDIHFNTVHNNQIFIATLSYMDKQGIWCIPMIKVINAKNKYLGAVVLIAPLIHFSENIKNSHISLKIMQFQDKSSDRALYDLDHSHNLDIKTVISYRKILTAAMMCKSDITISDTYSPLHTITSYATFTMPAKHVQKLFWNKFIYNLIIFSFCALSILSVCMFKISRLAGKVNNIEDIFVSVAIRLQDLIPGFSDFTSLKRLESSDAILVNIERFVDATRIVANTIEKQNDVILSQEKQIPDLRKHFLSYMGILHEYSLCLVEKIDDIYTPIQKGSATLEKIF